MKGKNPRAVIQVHTVKRRSGFDPPVPCVCLGTDLGAVEKISGRQIGSEFGSMNFMSNERSKLNAQPTVFTVGHSTRTIGELIHLLHAHGVTRVIDVRTVPRSRHNPQFNRDSLNESLQASGIGYTHLAELGGLRHPRRDSINIGWRNDSFRGYADYMQTPEFHAALDHLIRLARHDQIALMCAEAVPWRCHRSLIADALLVRGIRTEDIMGSGPRKLHTLTGFAKVHGDQIFYPAESSQSDYIQDSGPGDSRFPGEMPWRPEGT